MGWSGGSEELCFDESLLSDNEIRGRSSFCICGALISELGFGNGGFKFLVEFVQIDN